LGSVKDLEIVKSPTKEKMGIGRFRFSNRYSVFDWGEMPDHIPFKGEALCLMGAFFFENLEERGIKTHYRGLVDRNGRLIRFDELDQPTDVMEFNLVNVYRPRVYRNEAGLKYDYSVFTPNLKNYLIPLEIIYRNGLPEGSSIFKRLEQGLITIEDLGLDHYPMPGEKLSKPIFDVSTKLEEKDRYITWSEAKKIAGLTDPEVDEIKDVLLKTDNIITEIVSEAGLVNEDGKIELAFDHERKLMIADVVGTLDECRFTYNGIHVSKEVARQFYRKTEWYKDVEEAKRRSEAEDLKDWRRICRLSPPSLDPQLKIIISEMYMAAANNITKKRFFEAPKLHEVVIKYQEYEKTKLETVKY